MINLKIQPFLIVGFLFLPFYDSIAQDTLPGFIRQELENLAESSNDEETDYSDLLADFEYYKAHPINLNHTNKDRLSELGLLNEFQINHLLNHIDKDGNLISIYELQSIDGFDIRTIENLLPYITINNSSEDPPMSLKEIIQHGQHAFIVRGQQILEKQKGFSKIDSAGIYNNPNSRYIGSPQKIYSRYRFRYGSNISIGITAEKDQGELFFKHNNRYNYPFYDSLLNGKQKNGFDFYSVHLFIKDIRFIKVLAIGDYQIEFGQGLTAWSGLAYGKSSESIAIKRSAKGIRPYTSTDENKFLRGFAFTTGTNHLLASGFFSRKKMDANTRNNNTTNEILYISSIHETGLHTTPSEILDKDAITQTIFGGNISYKKREYTIGITGMHTLFDVAINPDPKLYNLFSFRGKEITNLGADYSLLFHNFNFFGEASYSTYQIGKQGSFAYMNGCIVSLDPRLSLSILHRNFQKDFHNLTANAFSENSTISNEQGIYLGINANPTTSIRVHAFYDRFKFPWLKYRINAPSYGNEFLIQLDYCPSKRFGTYIRVNQKNKFTNDDYFNSDSVTIQNGIKFIIPHTQTNYRWNIHYQILDVIILSNRFEYVSINTNNNEYGYLMYQDLTYKKTGGRFSCTLRYAYFDTKSFNSRIYAYENNIPGYYSIPSYYYKGSRVYILFNYTISKNIECWLRWSQTYYANQNTISLGTLNEIQGNKKNEIQVQMKLTF